MADDGSRRLNLTTGAAYALLGAMPMVMITGQKGILSRKQAGFQVVDMVATMRPLTKMAHQIVSPTTIPALVREAFRMAQQERPGPGISNCPRTWRPSRQRRYRCCRRIRSTGLSLSLRRSIVRPR